ncbi:MAG: hypothetical protein KI791_19945 [Cyclobacteriaceae bacterium]|nr:hypothetical protein [Cyclobacteriaceae bacterium SS2]
MIASLNQLLKEQGYTLNSGMDSTIITRSITGSLVMILVFTIIGGLTIYISLDVGHSYAHFIGFALMLIPYTIDKRRFPNLVVFDRNRKEVRLRSGFFFKKTLTFNEVIDVFVDESVLSSDTSPFKEGNKDYIYSFYLTEPSKKHKLLRLQYRKAMDEEVKAFMDFFDKSLNYQAGNLHKPIQ